MASATFESVRVVRSAITAERRRAALRAGMIRGGAPCARRLPGHPRRAARRSGAFVRGIGASLLLATGYVAAVCALRALLAAS